MAARYPDDDAQTTSDSRPNDGNGDDIDAPIRLPNRKGNMEDETDAGLENSHPSLSDMEILNIAGSIPINHIRRLGIKLGFEWSEVDGYLATNRMDGNVSSKGTENMLNTWRNRKPGPDQRIQMRKALVEADLAFVAEKHVLKDPNLREPLMPDNEIEQCRKDLIQYYCDDACKIKTSPLDPDNYVELDKIYINLKMEVKENQTTTTKKTRKAYEDIMNLLSKRVMFVGEAGVGKTTLCAKMAHDWATGKHFKNINLLFLIFLRDMDNHKSLGEIVKEHLSDSNDVKEKQIDEYARTNPDKVLILLDGLDEFNGRAKIIQEIIESTKLKSCQVIVTMRPSNVQTISTKDRLSKIYTRVDVEGFSENQVKQYVQKFFLPDPVAGEALLRFMQDKGSVIAETIAPYPVYCTMLCHLWNDEKRREVIKKFQNYFHFFDEMVYQLKEHHLSKSIGDGEELDFTKVDACFEVLGKIAFKGLVDKQMVFDKGSFEGGDMALAYEVGILSTKTKRLAPRAMRRTTGKRFLEEVFFPHKLLQEFMASIHLFSCHHIDPGHFKKILKKNMIRDYMEFKYVFYFTAARGPDIGRDTMRLLRVSRVHEDFLVDTAFECQDKSVSKPITRKLLVSDPAVILTDFMHAHTVTSYLYTMDTFDDVEKLAYDKTSLGQTLSHQAAVTTFSAQNVHELSLSEASFHEDFYVIMADTSKSSLIEKVIHRNSKLSKDDSLRYAIGLCNMPRLVELELDSVYLYPAFYGPFADPSSNCKIQTLTLSRQAFNKVTFQAMLAAPSLRSLILDRLIVMSRDEGDVPVTMATHVSSHVTKLDIDDKTLLASRDLGLMTSCSLVSSLVIRCSRDELTNDVIECLQFPCLADLHLDGSTREDTCLEESTSICNSLRDRWPVLDSLTVSNVLIDDAQGENILHTARHHQFLKRLKFFKCFMESELIEGMCTDIREEGQIDIEINILNDEELYVYDEEDEYSRRESIDFDEYFAVQKEFGDDGDDDDDEEEQSDNGDDDS